MINSSHLHLHLAQLLCLVENAEKKNYDTERITEHLKDIKTVLNRLATYDFDSLNENWRINFRTILNYFSCSLRYVQNSTVDDVSSEIFYGLRKAMEDWVKDSESYIFVASEGEYGFSPNTQTDDIYQIIEVLFGIKLKHKLVFFNVPAHLKNDFACNTALYHELGHFIDIVQFHFSYTIYIKGTKRELPFDLFNLCDVDNNDTLLSHLSEYFADLFAAQYVGKSAYTYLDYVAHGTNASKTHPSTQNRIKLIDEFIDQTNGEFAPLVELFKNQVIEYFKSQVDHLDQKLTYRSSEIDVSTFLNNKCVYLNDKTDIHKMISSIWPLWNTNKNKFKDATGNTISFFDAYKQISKLFEESIKNLRN